MTYTVRHITTAKQCDFDVQSGLFQLNITQHSISVYFITDTTQFKHDEVGLD